MEERRKRSSRTSNSVENRNIRSINNSREVSRRTKGKTRYPYEEDMRSSARRREEGESYYIRSDRKRKAAHASSGYRRDVNMKKMEHKQHSAYEDSQPQLMKRRTKEKHWISKVIGIMMAIAQFVLSVVLVVNVLFFGMLTSTYILVLAAVLVILLGITLLTQIGTKGKGIPGKVFCTCLCVVLAGGSFYISQINSAIQNIAGGSTRTSSMVVAVRAADSAQKLEDIREYKLGVQYATNADQIQSTLHQVEKELSQQMNTQEYSDIIAEVEGLRNGEVDAIIYNSGQTGIVQDQIPTFSDDVRIIYTHKLVVEIDNEMLDTSVTEPFAVYLSGMDTYEEITQADRSDVNIIAVVNPQTHQVLLVTTPRDYYVEIPGISGGQEDKLTHAGIYGVDASMATLSQLYDVELPFYGRINFSSLINIVDTLGGLDVESDLEFDTGWESGAEIHINEGMNHLGGLEALAFCRERHAIADGDNARGRHQQAVITAMIKKMMSPTMLRKATDIINTVSAGVDTNVSVEQIQALVKTQLRTGADWSIFSVQAEGAGTKRTCYSSGSTPLYVAIPVQKSVDFIKTLINRVLAGEVLTETDVQPPEYTSSDYYVESYDYDTDSSYDDSSDYDYSDDYDYDAGYDDSYDDYSDDDYSDTSSDDGGGDYYDDSGEDYGDSSGDESYDEGYDDTGSGEETY